MTAILLTVSNVRLHILHGLKGPVQKVLARGSSGMHLPGCPSIEESNFPASSLEHCWGSGGQDTAQPAADGTGDVGFLPADSALLQRFHLTRSICWFYSVKHLKDIKLHQDRFYLSVLGNFSQQPEIQTYILSGSLLPFF